MIYPFQSLCTFFQPFCYSYPTSPSLGSADVHIGANISMDKKSRTISKYHVTNCMQLPCKYIHSHVRFDYRYLFSFRFVFSSMYEIKKNLAYPQKM